ASTVPPLGSCTRATSSSSSPTRRWTTPRLASSSPASCSSTPRTASSAPAPTLPRRCPAPASRAATSSTTRSSPTDMSLLCLDIGNRLSVIGVWRESQGGEPVLAGRWTVSSEATRTADEWYLLAHGFVRAAGLGDDEVTAVSMCCTVPAIGVEMRAMMERYFHHVPVWVVGPGVRTGIAIHTDNPREVGTDRIVNALAAHHLFGGPAIIVDLNGTA